MKRATAEIVVSCLACLAHGQPAAAKPEFEVASVKPAPPSNGQGIRIFMRGGPGSGDPTRVVIENFNLFLLVRRAYDLRNFQIAGVEIGDAERFNITAKVPEGATKDDLSRMLQNLLTERFKLKFHRETKEMSMFELVIGKNGPKLKESAGPPPEFDPTAAPAPVLAKQDKDGYPIPPPGVIAMMSMNGAPRARFNAVNESMEDFIGMISNTVGRPVVDRTGLKGKYDFILSWSPEPPPGAVAPASLSPDDAGPTFISAVQEQLGLKLDSKKGPVEMLVIEHYEKVPTEN
jgi:uncharacterized protein (TIGR03435 family)